MQSLSFDRLLAKLDNKKKQLDSLLPLDPDLIKNLEEWYKIELTYTSNAIEGNTLTRRETAIIVEKGLTIGGKSLIEHLEATNHAKALEYIHSISYKEAHQITESDILAIHNIILSGIDDRNAGRYRTVAVRIAGSSVIMPNPLKVQSLMNGFLTWLQDSQHQDMHLVELAAEAHYRLVTIHPFADGNGRSARLLMNLILMTKSYPPIIIKPQERLFYIDSLETAQLGGSKDKYKNLMINAAIESINIYLKAAKGERATKIEKNEGATTEHLIRIGKLAKMAGESVATIRFWTNEGLLKVASFTQAHYQLYQLDTIELCKKIRKLQKHRLTIAEIKDKLDLNES